MSEKNSQSANWDISKSAGLYGIDFWGHSYFSINSLGHAQVHPKGQPLSAGVKSPALDLFKITQELQERGARLPLLLRFPDIIRSQMESLRRCFAKAAEEQSYKGKYYGVFPIKVNQQRHIIEDIVRAGGERPFGLEAGSRPELLIALALMDSPEAMIICNGFKDRNYIELALLSQKAGKNIFIVVERRRELNAILETARELGIRPQVGFRLKLHTQAEGFWGKSGGCSSKFGLTSSELISAVEYLKREKSLDCAKLAHFHIGSQIPSIQPIKAAIKESARLMTELRLMGCPIEYIDVGGGLGVDYDGSGSARSSTNYDVQEYANDIVFGIQSVCDEKSIPHPHIISESGRFLLAQSSLLICDVLDSSAVKSGGEIKARENSPAFLKEIYDIYKNIPSVSYNETFNDLVEKRKEMRQLFVYGVLSLKEMAAAEQIYWKSVCELKDLTENNPDYEDIFETLKQLSTDTYFCNFSVFQSLPDSWALSYIFPVMPLFRLDEKPDRRARLADLTCDSDGQISNIIDYTTWKVESHLPVHKLRPGESYLIGIFLTGAYQEILGDLHNLFGDTDAAHIRAEDDGSYSVEHWVDGDSISEVLEYVEFHRKDLLGKIHRAAETGVRKGSLSRREAGLLLQRFEENLSQYTYLKPPALKSPSK